MNILMMVLLLSAPLVAANEPEVKYCKDYITGEVIVIQAGYPCPAPTSEF